MVTTKKKTHCEDDRKIQIYCDRLRLAVLVRAVGLRTQYSRRGILPSILVLDPLAGRWPVASLTWLMARLGFAVSEVPFFTGHVATPSGLSVYIAARRQAFRASLDAATVILARSALLSRLNAKWGRNTIQLYVAHHLWLPLESVYLRVLIVQSLSREAGTRAHLILRRAPGISSGLFGNPAPEVRVSFYGLSAVRVATLARLIGPIKERVRGCLRRASGAIRGLVRGASRVSSTYSREPVIPAQELPGLLMIQEDELSMDRSYRTQPHWYFPQEGSYLPFCAYVLADGSLPLPDGNTITELQAHRIEILPRGGYLSAPWSVSGHPASRQLRWDAISCFVAAIVRWPFVEAAVLINVVRLLWHAQSLVEVCDRFKINTFLVSESYKVDARAMLLVAPVLNVQTVVFQYSNLARVGPAMLTTADIMVTFSSLYHERWTHKEGIRPKAFVDNGYVFNTSFNYVRARADACRSKLREAGANFIICYFDESVQHGKYGIISQQDHRAEILALAQLVLDDPSVGLVVKTQFMWNSPHRLDELNDALASARATGRYVELSHGTHRNIIFPAEAALSADIAIGHAVGATAPLEAALVGVRCIILNPYEWGGKDSLYAQADIVYPSMHAALEAIRNHRMGVPDRVDLGDWSPIIGHFDLFRDGRAGYRLRRLLDKVVMRNENTADTALDQYLQQGLASVFDDPEFIHTDVQN